MSRHSRICRNNCSRLVVCYECERKKKTLSAACRGPVSRSAADLWPHCTKGSLSYTSAHSELYFDAWARRWVWRRWRRRGLPLHLAARPSVWVFLLWSAGGRLSADGCHMQSRKNAADSNSAEPERSGCTADRIVAERLVTLPCWVVELRKVFF